MNILKRWRAIRLVERQQREADEKTALDEKHEKLKHEIKDVRLALAEIGINCLERYSTNDEYSQSTMYGKNGDQLIKVTVFPGGGYRLEKL